MKSSDRGVSWDVLSDDLTRNNIAQQGKGGEPISNEQITAESYNNLFNIEESPLKEGVIWVGSDDGLVHVTQDGGGTWTNVTPKGLKESIINVVEPSPHDPATAYIAVTGYKLNDFSPYIFRTNDYGKTWTKIVDGIPVDTFARSVREDPDRKGLLYAGTETGVFVSFDDGKAWLPLQNNLPEVPITDLRVQRKDLVVATQGRALWILDDLTVLHQISEEVANADYYLFKPNDTMTELSVAYSIDGGFGENPPKGVQINYILNKTVSDSTIMSIEIINEGGQVIHSEYSNLLKSGCNTLIKPQLQRKSGAHRYQWNMKIGRFDCLKELADTNRDLTAYNAPPGLYKLRLTIGDFTQLQDFEITIDPRLESSIPNIAAAYKERDGISESIYTGATEMAKGVRDLRKIKQQLDFILQVSDDKDIKLEGGQLNQIIDDWIANILQKEMRTGQSNYMFEARLLIKFKDFLNRIGKGNLPVTQGTREVSKDYLNQWNTLRSNLQNIKTVKVLEYNQQLKNAGLPELYRN
eukprot:TRINITY_DN1460_c0_g1_i1.p1 TRINITY_DN1460_c0_g1~~TRINITY_DN1460_c0_g1_i1.p1  ORF type:complete len:524 (-),score=102.86 TRINITY_DN1460_c0_g1_i1:212-1783(-)